MASSDFLTGSRSLGLGSYRTNLIFDASRKSAFQDLEHARFLELILSVNILHRNTIGIVEVTGNRLEKHLRFGLDSLLMFTVGRRKKEVSIKQQLAAGDLEASRKRRAGDRCCEIKISSGSSSITGTDRRIARKGASELLCLQS